MRNIALPITVTLLTAAACFGCTRKVDDPAPMQTGSRLVYEVSEQQGGMSKTYQLTMDFTKSDDGLVARVSGPKGNDTIKLDLEGVPDDDDLAYQLDTSGTLDLGMLYLPAKDRRSGVTTKAGKITKKRPYLNWQTWEVMRRTANAQGSLFFDDGLGVLVGWNMMLGQKAVIAKLVDSK